MEVTVKESFFDRITKLFLKGPKPFSTRQEINWSFVRNFSIGVIIVFIFGILIFPTAEKEETEFHQKVQVAEVIKEDVAKSPTEDTLAQLQSTSGFSRSMTTSLNDYSAPSRQQSGGGSNSGERSASMILSGEGGFSRGKLPIGSKIVFKLVDSMTITSQAMPFVGQVVKDATHEDSLAIPEGSKIYGEITFDDGSERANVTFQTIIFPNGRERPFSAIAVGNDGRIGIQGRVHSKAIQNALGQTLTRFVGAYAEGSMARGQMGVSAGGHENGLKHAVSETAKDYAESFGEELQKEQKWIEVSAGAIAEATINQPFVFRDPGATNGL